MLTTENPANGIKDLMWSFLMDKGQKENNHNHSDDIDLLL